MTVLDEPRLAAIQGRAAALRAHRIDWRRVALVVLLFVPTVLGRLVGALYVAGVFCVAAFADGFHQARGPVPRDRR